MVDHNTFGDAVQVTILAMGIVFVTLFLLSLVMTAMKPLFHKEPKASPKPAVQPVVAQTEVPVEQETNALSPQKVAVIASAIAAYLGQSPENLNIVAIRRAPAGTTPWAVAARSESMQK